MALASLIGVLVWSVMARQGDGGVVDMLDGLPQNAVVAADAGRPGVGGRWLVTSGTLFSRNGELWSGVPDAGPPDHTRGRTGSAVLRSVTMRRDYRDVHVRVEMRLNALGSTKQTAEQSWDGVHVFLRYRNAQSLYVVDLARRDGLVTIKRKSSPDLSDRDTLETATPTRKGAYTQLATAQMEPVTTWRRFDLGITNKKAGVEITLAVGGRTLLAKVDNDSVAAIRGPGRVGIRGDNADFLVRHFTIRPSADKPRRVGNCGARRQRMGSPT